MLSCRVFLLGTTLRNSWKNISRKQSNSIALSWHPDKLEDLKHEGNTFRIYHCSKWLGRLYTWYSPNTIWSLLMSVFKPKLAKIFRRYLQWNCETAFSLMVPFVSSAVAQKIRHKGTATLDGCVHRKRSLFRALLTMELPLRCHHLLWTVFCYSFASAVTYAPFTSAKDQVHKQNGDTVSLAPERSSTLEHRA